MVLTLIGYLEHSQAWSLIANMIGLRNIQAQAIVVDTTMME